MSVTDLRPVLVLDRNLLPIGEKAALDVATKELLRLVRDELPEDFYHLTRDDAMWITSNVVGAFMGELRRQQGVRG